MLAIIYKNIIESRKALLFSLVAAAFFILAGIISLVTAPNDAEAEIVIIFMFFLGMISSYLIIGSAQGDLIGCDQNSRFYCFIFSAPNGRFRFIAAKYLGMLIISLVEACVFMLIAKLLDCGISLLIPIFFTLIQLLMRAIEAPFMVSLGAKTGTSVKGCILGGAAMVFVIYSLYGEHSLFIEDYDITGIMNFFSEIFGSESSRLMWLGIIGGAVFIIYIASMLLSVHLAKKGAVRFAESNEE